MNKTILIAALFACVVALASAADVWFVHGMQGEDELQVYNGDNLLATLDESSDFQLVDLAPGDYTFFFNLTNPSEDAESDPSTVYNTTIQDNRFTFIISQAVTPATKREGFSDQFTMVDVSVLISEFGNNAGFIAIHSYDIPDTIEVAFNITGDGVDIEVSPDDFQFEDIIGADVPAPGQFNVAIDVDGTSVFDQDITLADQQIRALIALPPAAGGDVVGLASILVRDTPANNDNDNDGDGDDDDPASTLSPFSFLL